MDFPIEILAGVGTGLAGFFFKSQTNAMDNIKQLAELEMKKQMTADQLATSAGKRSNPKARKVLAYMIVGTFIVGLLVWAIIGIWQPDTVVSLVNSAPQKSFLWGLIKWGGGDVVTEARGFVLPPWTGWVISIVVGFFFGTGAAKPAR